MKNIDLPDFGPPGDFIDLHGIVKRHTEQDLAWEEEIFHISSMTLGQVKKFMEHPIKALIFLQ
jgi:hypothetical protein